MTKMGSCKTCKYFDSKDWDSEDKNWCRYNDLPAINEGLCGYYEPMIKSCPFCGSTAIAWDKIHPHVRCSNHECEVALFEDTMGEAIEKWNRRVSE